jgi:hypothetical protein
MSEVTTEPTGAEQSTGEQVKERVGEATQQVQEKALEARGQARERISEQLDTRSTEAGKQVRVAAEALRRTSYSMRNEGQEWPANAMDQAATRGDRLATYLTEANGDRMLRDLEQFARRQPWLATTGGLALGFFASRFLKASSARRYEGNGMPSSTETAELPVTVSRASSMTQGDSSGGH